MRRFSGYTAVFLIGSVGYSFLEILWRGYTHWSMTLTGGVCLLLLYMLHIRCGGWPLVLRAFLGAAGITAAELAVGCLVNLRLGWDVWDYSDRPLNLLGQICPLYSAIWILLSLLAAPLCRRLAAVLE